MYEYYFYLLLYEISSDKDLKLKDAKTGGPNPNRASTDKTLKSKFRKLLSLRD